MKQILLIATGGTIASRRGDSGLKPALTSQELLSYVPDAAGFCRTDTLQLFNIDSTNMQPHHWLEIAEAIQKHYGQYDGFVVCHGTDTMAYTAAALSYLIQNSPKPIVVTGSQKPIDMEITDAKTNLLDRSAVCLLSPGPRRLHRLRRQSHRRHPRQKGADQELQRVFQHQFPLSGRYSGFPYPVLPGRQGYRHGTGPVLQPAESESGPAEADSFHGRLGSGLYGRPL